MMTPLCDDVSAGVWPDCAWPCSTVVTGALEPIKKLALSSTATNAVTSNKRFTIFPFVLFVSASPTSERPAPQTRNRGKNDISTVMDPKLPRQSQQHFRCSPGWAAGGSKNEEAPCPP